MLSTIALTGGKTAKLIYREMRNIDKDGFFLEKINFLMTDERCVDSNDIDSNHRMILESLFLNKIPKSSVFYKMYHSNCSIEYSVDAYENLVPPVIDLLILSVGSDGHIASIFNDSLIVPGRMRLVGSVSGAKIKLQRITLLPFAFARAKTTVILALGDEKKKYAIFAKEAPKKLENLPVSLVGNAIWITGNNFNVAAKKVLDIWNEILKR